MIYGGYLLSLEEPLPSPVPSPAVTTAVSSVVTEPVMPMVPPTPDDKTNVSDTGSARKTERAQVFVVEATEGSASSVMCADAQDVGPDLTREGPFDACEAEPEPGQSPLVLNSMPGCQFRMMSYDDRDNRDDLDPAYGIHLHDPPYDGIYGGPRISTPSRPVARLLARTYGPGTDSSSSAPIAPRHKPHYDKCAGHVAVCDKFKQDGVGGHENSLRQGAVSDRRGSFRDTGAQSSTCGALYDRYGLVAPYQCSGISGTHLGLFLQLLHVV